MTKLINNGGDGDGGDGQNDPSQGTSTKDRRHQGHIFPIPQEQSKLRNKDNSNKPAMDQHQSHGDPHDDGDGDAPSF